MVLVRIRLKIPCDRWHRRCIRAGERAPMLRTVYGHGCVTVNGARHLLALTLVDSKCASLVSLATFTVCQWLLDACLTIDALLGLTCRVCRCCALCRRKLMLVLLCCTLKLRYGVLSLSRSLIAHTGLHQLLTFVVLWMIPVATAAYTMFRTRAHSSSVMLIFIVFDGMCLRCSIAGFSCGRCMSMICVRLITLRRKLHDGV